MFEKSTDGSFLGGEEGEDSSLPVGAGEEVGDNIYSCLAEA